MTMPNLLVALVLGAALAGANVVVIGPRLDGCPACMALLVGGPALLAIALAAAARATARPAPLPPPPPAPPAEPSGLAALRLLATLQEEGRLVDFFTEDIAPYSDEQVGAATRGIHASCRKALTAAVALEPVMAGTEGDAVTVPAGFDAAAIRLTGNVSGAPPFSGVLRHPGWRATAVTLPARAGHDPHVVAPAEVEIG
jgi:uncharacterized protein DUF2760